MQKLGIWAASSDTKTANITKKRPPVRTYLLEKYCEMQLDGTKIQPYYQGMKKCQIMPY